MIASAQDKLARRASLHREKVTTEGELCACMPSSHAPFSEPQPSFPSCLPITPTVLDPAAHLDPQGYNIYGGVSLSFSKVSVPLETKATWEQRREHGSPQERALMNCRTLYLRYLAGTGNCGMCCILCTCVCVFFCMCMYVH